jgi:hypothetical protein
MNTTHKLIIAVAVVVNLAAIVTVSAMTLHRHAVQAAQTIQLGAIVVTPTEADWSYAEARGVHRPVVTVQLGAITVTPTLTQLAEIADSKTVNTISTGAADAPQDAATVSLIEALAAFSPGQYLETDADLRLLNALVFERAGG